jgi:uncharacterized protein (TIGR02444 family)
MARSREGTETKLDLEGPHWQFALAIYSQPGVADACLMLQDRLGLDINILLFVTYATTELSMTVTAEDIQAMDAAVQAWRTETVMPLRALRRRLKQRFGPLESEYAEQLRSKVKQTELLAEQIELAMLARWLGQRSGDRAVAEVGLSEVLNRVIAHFVKGTYITPGADALDLDAAVSTVSRAAKCAKATPITSSL